MKKMLLRTIVFCMTGSLLVLSAFAQQPDQNPAKPGKEPGLSPTGRSTMHGQSFRASKAINAEVKTAQGENLGKIEDLIVNPTTGKIEFAVINREDKLSPLPWQMLSSAPTAGRPGLPATAGADQCTFTANVDKQKLDQAVTIDKNQWPEFSASWKQQVYSHYGVSESGIGAPGSPSGAERGLGTPDRRPGQDYRRPGEPPRSPTPTPTPTPRTPDNPNP